ncbi:class I SAM-dependent methyltransferase [Chloroflexota bacterium]
MKPEELKNWFENLRELLETAYLSNAEPWKQSGMSGPEERWISLRKPVAECIDKSGSFLDIGCANGYLLECCIKWTAEKGIKIKPYGLDISSELIELAKKRLPEYAGHFFVGNGLTWLPPRRFDFVRTELVYVSAEYEKQYIEYILTNYLNAEGKLLVTNYGEDLPNLEENLPPGAHPTKKIISRLAELGFQTFQSEDGYDPIKDKRTRVAVLTAESHR